jgi:hypothetical protein
LLFGVGTSGVIGVFILKGGGWTVKFENVKRLFVVFGIVGLLLFSSPLLNAFLIFPRSEPFSELYVLGQNHMLEDYPFNIVQGQDYSVYVGVINRLYSSAYYKINVKFAGENDKLPNLEVGVPSPLPSLYTYRLLLKNDGISENVLTFSVPQAGFSGKTSSIDSIVINSNVVRVDRYAVWNNNSSGFYYQMFFELWLYDAAISDFRFDNRSVGFWINMTQFNLMGAE